MKSSTASTLQERVISFYSALLRPHLEQCAQFWAVHYWRGINSPWRDQQGIPEVWSGLLVLWERQGLLSLGKSEGADLPTAPQYCWGAHREDNWAYGDNLARGWETAGNRNKTFGLYTWRNILIRTVSQWNKLLRSGAVVILGGVHGLTGCSPEQPHWTLQLARFGAGDWTKDLSFLIRIILRSCQCCCLMSFCASLLGVWGVWIVTGVWKSGFYIP